jgi:hypothetical protein
LGDLLSEDLRHVIDRDLQIAHSIGQFIAARGDGVQGAYQIS